MQEPPMQQIPMQEPRPLSEDADEVHRAIIVESFELIKQTVGAYRQGKLQPS